MQYIFEKYCHVKSLYLKSFFIFISFIKNVLTFFKSRVTINYKYFCTVKGFVSMKHLHKKTPLFIILSVVAILAITISMFALSSNYYDFNGDSNVDNEDVLEVMQGIVGEKEVTQDMKDMVDFDGNGVINVLDVIAFKNYINQMQNLDANFTRGIY